MTASIAVSIGAFRNPVFTVAAEFAVHLAKAILERGLPEDTLLNVNVPNLSKEEIGGVTITRQGMKRYVSRLEKRTDPRGRTYYWLTGEPTPLPDEEGTDSWALARGRISVTPIGLDLTDGVLRRTVEAWELRFPG